MIQKAIPFPRRPIPVVGESFYGFERRFAACTRFESMGSFRHAAGLLYMAPRSKDHQWERLANAVSQPVSELEHLRWAPTGSKPKAAVVHLLGHEVRSCQLRSERLRFCPLCLAEGNGPERRLHRQVWQLNLVTACPHHRTLLVDACDDCGETFEHSRKTKIWACACGKDMIDVDTVPAPDGAVSMSLAIIRHFGVAVGCGKIVLDRSGVLPLPFERLSLDDLLTVTARIGLLASTPPQFDQPLRAGQKPHATLPTAPDISIEDAVAVTEAAYEVIHSWPQSADGLFNSLADRNNDPAMEHPIKCIFATKMGYRLLEPLRSLGGRKIPLIEEALHKWLHGMRGIYIDGRRRPKVGSNGDLAIDVTDALFRLEGRSTEGRRARSWQEAGLITFVGKKVMLSSVLQSLENLGALASVPLTDGLALDDWSKGIHFHGGYHRSDALKDILAGRIRVQRLQQGDGLSQFLVSHSDLLSRRNAGLPPRAQHCSRASPKLSKMSRAERRFERRIANLRENDAFMQPGKLNALLQAATGCVPTFDVTTHSEIRCEYRVRRYHNRECPMRLYSVSDALACAGAIC